MKLGHVIFIVFFTLAYGIVHMLASRDEKKMLSILQKRQLLTDDEIYHGFYASRGIDKKHVLELWHEIANVLEIKAGYMRPDDKFGKDIGLPIFGINDALDELGNIALHRAEKQGISVNPPSIATVDDYVKHFTYTCPEQESFR